MQRNGKAGEAAKTAARARQQARAARRAERESRRFDNDPIDRSRQGVPSRER